MRVVSPPSWPAFCLSTFLAVCSSNVFRASAGRTAGLCAKNTIVSAQTGNDPQNQPRNAGSLRDRAVDNAVWIACAHWLSSDPSLRSLIIDPYGQIMSSSVFQQDGLVHYDIDLDNPRVYYAGRKKEQVKRGDKGIPSYFSEDMPEQRPGWREMLFAARRPELYAIIPTVNEVTKRYRPAPPPG
jgi:hypothetical protein